MKDSIIKVLQSLVQKNELAQLRHSVIFFNPKTHQIKRKILDIEISSKNVKYWSKIAKENNIKISSILENFFF
jgi:hypothetical protein